MLRSTMLTRAAAAAALALTLAACGGGDGDGERQRDASPSGGVTSEAAPTTAAAPPSTSAPATETETEAEPTPSGAVTPGAEGSLGFDPDPAFLGGIEEAWRVPGLLPMNNQDHSLFSVWREGSMVAVYEATAEPSEPIWEGGPCASAGMAGNRLICDTTVIDLATGAATPLPIQDAMFVHSDGEIIVMQTSDNVAVGFGPDLTEIWRVDNVAQASGGTGSIRTLYLVPADPAAADSQLITIEVATGETLDGGAFVQEAMDGYVALDTFTGTVTGVYWDGTQAFQVTGETAWGAPMPVLGRLLTVADFKTCVDLPDSLMPPPSTWTCLSAAGVPTLAKIETSGATVEGVTYPGAGLLNYFVDTGHLLVTGSPLAEPTISLYAIGSGEPIWQVTAEYGLIPMGDGSVMLASNGPDTILYRPAGG